MDFWWWDNGDGDVAGTFCGGYDPSNPTQTTAPYRRVDPNTGGGMKIDDSQVKGREKFPLAPYRRVDPNTGGGMKIDDTKVNGKEKFPFGSEQLSNRFLYEVLPDKSWKGKPCFIVGGGPSLEDFNWSLLKGRRVIGINRVYEKFDPTIIFSMDTRFLRWIMDAKYGHEAVDAFLRSKAYKVWLCTYNCKLPEDIFILRVWKNYSQGFRAFPTIMREGIGHGNNSGYGALNLAVCLGASPIYLLGFDMKYADGKTHWHKGHPVPHRANTVQRFKQYFKMAAIKTKKMGIEVINLDPASALPYFPKKSFSEILH